MKKGKFMLKNKWITNKFLTLLIVVILIAFFIGLNLWIGSMDIKKIDVTESKLYSLTDASKKEIKNIEKDVNIYVYRYDEKDSVVDLIKQYCKENEHLKYQILTEENNKDKIEKFDLASLYEEYKIVIVEVGEAYTMLNGEYDFSNYDYTLGQQIDLTEQKITNAILNLAMDNKTKVYFTSGHSEVEDIALGVLKGYLENEAYEVENIDLISVSSIPDDCNTLIILSPEKDFTENEADIVINYINNGGNIIYAKDTEENGKIYVNIQRILDVYGVGIENGYVYEMDSNNMVSGTYSTFEIPNISEESEITNEIYSSNGNVVMPFAQKVIYLDEQKAEESNIEYQTLLTSSNNAYYVSDVTINSVSEVINQEKGMFDIAVLATKTIQKNEENDEKSLKSKLVIIGNCRFIEDYCVEEISKQYPLSYIGNNKDFMLNSIAKLSSREDALVIRKQMDTSTYLPTAKEDLIVKLIIFLFPIIIICTGLVIWKKRKKQN